MLSNSILLKETVIFKMIPKRILLRPWFKIMIHFDSLMVSFILIRFDSLVVYFILIHFDSLVVYFIPLHDYYVHDCDNNLIKDNKNNSQWF